MFQFRKSHKTASSRNQIDILGAKDGVLLLTHNRFRLILEVSAINFELKSEHEQDALIDTYESFLNSLSISLQYVIRIRAIDIEKYLIDGAHSGSEKMNRIYTEQRRNYHEFLRSLVTTNKILSRHFYVVIPFDAESSAVDFSVVTEQLSLNADIVSKGLARMGMHSRELSSIEVLDLFYSYYNPLLAKIQPLSLQTMNLLQTSFIHKEA